MKKKVSLWLVVTVALALHGCNIPPVTQWFPTTPREIYERDLRRAKLDKTPAGQAWLRAGERVLADSLTIPIPFRERSYFGDSVMAQSYVFTLPAGRRLSVSADPESTDTSLQVFADLFRVNALGKTERVSYLAKGETSITYGGEKEEKLLLRLQTALFNQAVVTIQLTTTPLLEFPVAGRSAGDIISFWGAARDGGGRRHEGVDIRASRGTPVVAAANGFITNVGTNRLGGNVISLSPSGLNISLYYAHLDSQLVSVGQRVKTGDTLGTVGNTGNAITTAPHLHFGIYAGWSGATDPLVYINNREEKLPQLPSGTQWLGDTIRLNRKDVLYHFTSRKGEIRPLEKYAVARVIGQVAKGYRIQLPDGTLGYLANPAFQPIARQVTKRKLNATQALIPEPGSTGELRLVATSETVEVLGYHDSYELVRTQDGTLGWLPVSAEL
ncbi:hypothetical protein GCM10027275_22730 [Rhabdobacter roseus]|uniref:Murein DD-endopeptidase MepM/ murein hydrolase activator NlpD n=1 Tax=Rhabdobacter roseus TaxID=1655419 RepID=A0A840TW83_9BACT|nr:M23 family metallopeptidase [Rhabdobacter roseus]MBB5284210.1 murein DD-endopeptidase MepM/ murein hydrolase activator NlpD [Rhabdobacter roseus]